MHTCMNICIDEDDSYRQYKRHESDLNRIVKEGAFGYSPSGDGVLGYVLLYVQVRIREHISQQLIYPHGYPEHYDRHNGGQRLVG